MSTTQTVFSHSPTRATRQSRFERSSDNPNLFLDANLHYFQVIQWLLRLRFMTTEQLGKVIHPPRSKSAVYDLLRRMFDAKLITRFEMPVRKKWGQGRTYGATRVIHCLDTRGAKFLADRLKIVRGEVDWKPRDNAKHGFLEHRLATNDLLIAMYLAAIQSGYDFELVQTEREIHKQGGHDWVRDPKTGQRKPVKSDAICRLTLPDKKAALLSLETDMGTEEEKKVKQKFRIHRRHYTSGKFTKRHGTKSSRVPFVVADVRDPLLPQPIDDLEWQKRIWQRVQTLQRWAKEEAMEWHFWFAPIFTLTPQTVWQEPLWLRPELSKPVPFISITRAGSI